MTKSDRVDRYRPRSVAGACQSAAQAAARGGRRHLRNNIDPMWSAVRRHPDVGQNELERMSAGGVEHQLDLLIGKPRARHDPVQGCASGQGLAESGRQGLGTRVKAQQSRVGVGARAEVLAIRIEVAVHDDANLHRARRARRALIAAVARHGCVGQQSRDEGGIHEVTGPLAWMTAPAVQC